MSRELKFTPKEKKVLKMIIQGKTYQEIADKFGNTRSRIYDIKATLLRKTGFDHINQLCYFAGTNKIV